MGVVWERTGVVWFTVNLQSLNSNNPDPFYPWLGKSHWGDWLNYLCISISERTAILVPHHKSRHHLTFRNSEQETSAKKVCPHTKNVKRRGVRRFGPQLLELGTDTTPSTGNPQRFNTLLEQIWPFYSVIDFVKRVGDSHWVPFDLINFCWKTEWGFNVTFDLFSRLYTVKLYNFFEMLWCVIWY